jgi:hypothetical protein
MSRHSSKPSNGPLKPPARDRPRAVAKGCLLVFAGASALTTVFIAHSCFVAGPHLTVARRADAVHIAGRFLGEYSLGFERLSITSAGSELVCGFLGSTTADVVLRPGLNTPQSLFGPTAQVSVAPGAPNECRLTPGHSYRVTVWGNTGSGRVRPSSIDVHL